MSKPQGSPLTAQTQSWHELPNYFYRLFSGFAFDCSVRRRIPSTANYSDGFSQIILIIVRRLQLLNSLFLLAFHFVFAPPPLRPQITGISNIQWEKSFVAFLSSRTECFSFLSDLLLYSRFWLWFIQTINTFTIIFIVRTPFDLEYRIDCRNSIMKAITFACTLPFMAGLTPGSCALIMVLVPKG